MNKLPFTRGAIWLALLAFSAGAGAAVPETVSGGSAASLSDSGRETGTALLRLKRLLKSGRYPEVISECRNLILGDPGCVPAYALLAKASDLLDERTSAGSAMASTAAFLDERIGLYPGNPYLSYGRGLCYRYQKNYLKAMQCYETAFGQGGDFWELYDGWIDYSHYREDFDKIQNALEKRVLRSPSAPALWALGAVHFRLSNYRKAADNLERCLPLVMKTGDFRRQSRIFRHVSDTLFYMNDYEGSRSSAIRALSLAGKAGSVEDRIDALYLIAFLDLGLGNIVNAQRVTAEGLALCEGIVDEKRRRSMLFAQANVDLERGDLVRAQEQLENNLNYFVDDDDVLSQMKSRYWLAGVLYEKGEYMKAMEYARGALLLSRQTGFRTGDVFHFAILADIALAVGDFSKSLQYSKEALAAAVDGAGKWSRENCLNTIGYVHVKKNMTGEALSYFLQALEFVRRIGYRKDEPKCLYNVGYAYLRMNDASSAEIYFKNSLDLAARQGNRIIEALCANGLGELSLRRGEIRKALAHYSNALDFGLTMKHPSIAMEAYAGLGQARFQEKNHEAAQACYEKAVDLIEDLRSHIRFRDFSSGFFKSKVSIYEDLINICWERHLREPDKGFDRECFAYAERARARSFLDDLRLSEATPRQSEDDRAAQYEIDILSRRISKLVTNLYSYDLEESQRNNLIQELDEAEDELQAIWAGYSNRRPDLGGIGKPASSAEVQENLLCQRTALVEYFIGEKNVFIFLVTKKELRVFRQGRESYGPVLAQASNYRNLLSTRDPSGFAGNAAGEQLYRSIFLPVKNILPPDIRRLIFVPDGELSALPFETLVSRSEGGRPHFLLEDYDISYAPSAATLMMIQGAERKNPGKRMDLLAVGSPSFEMAEGNIPPYDPDSVVRDYYLDKRFRLYPLKFARAEISRIAKFFGRAWRQVIVGENAKEETIKNLPLNEFRIIHFATHSLLDDNVASRSALVLTLDQDPVEDGFFRARDIYQTDLDADLVVLSACQTAAGAVEKGEGISGLSRAFFCAGARSVVASLWDINDRSTQKFMTFFYRNLVNGLSKEESLRQAKISMMKTDFRHPYFWAAFVLMGESGDSLSRSPLDWKDRILNIF